MTLSRYFLVALLAAAAVRPAVAQVSADVVSKLEARKQAKPNDVATLRALGIAYFKNKRYADAEGVLKDAQRLSPKDAVSALYLGMSAEERGDMSAARSAYTVYLANGKTKSARDAVSQRLAAVAQRELAANARAAVAQERSLSGATTNPNTVAVLPLRVTGAEMYQPLGRGLADMMISDFGRIPGLTLLERDRIQAMYDEIALGRTTAVDAASAARSGRLLQAGRIVHGTLAVPSVQNIQIATQIVSVPTTQTTPGANANGALDNIFDYEKTIVIETLRRMGMTLTPEQERDIRGNVPTRNLQAFLAYSRGLASMDAGRLDEAATFFDNARALDPAFRAAASRGDQARAGRAGQSVTTTQIEGTLRGGSEGQTVQSAERGLAAGVSEVLSMTLQNALTDVNPSAADAIGRASTSASTRDATSSTTARDGASLTKTGTLTIVIKRP